MLNYFILLLSTSEEGEKTIDKLAYHGCEGDLAAKLHLEVEVLCSGHTNACYNVSFDDIQYDWLSRVEACFCDGDRLGKCSSPSRPGATTRCPTCLTA